MTRKLQKSDGSEGISRVSASGNCSESLQQKKIELQTDGERNSLVQTLLPLVKQTREEMGEIDKEKGLRDWPAPSDGILRAELLEFRRNYPLSTLLIALTTEEEWEQATEGLPEALQALE